MNYLGNEKGTSVFYLLSLLGTVLLIFVLVINIIKVYVVKEQANTAVEQAAFAGTSVLIHATKKTIEEFDQDPLLSELQKEDDGMSLSTLIKKGQEEYTGLSDSEAYIKALNEILPGKINKYPGLSFLFESRFSDSAITTMAAPTIYAVLNENNANTENVDDVEIHFSTTEGRLEVKSNVIFESISDNDYIAKFQEEVSQKGYGPSLVYLQSL